MDYVYLKRCCSAALGCDDFYSRPLNNTEVRDTNTVSNQMSVDNFPVGPSYPPFHIGGSHQLWIV